MSDIAQQQHWAIIIIVIIKVAIRYRLILNLSDWLVVRYFVQDSQDYKLYVSASHNM